MDYSGMDMRGKVCLVTGATNGIGQVTALELAKLGAQVVIVARSQQRGQAALDDIQRQTGSDTAEMLLADLSDQAQVRKLAADFRARHDRLHVLVNNAGALNFRRLETVDGLELTFAVNHMAYYILTHSLRDMLTASAPARVINVSSSAHYDGVIDFDAAVRDPNDPTKFKAEYYPGLNANDWLHLNVLGYKAMADAIDLNLFTP